jgi:hypothetical protein
MHSLSKPKFTFTSWLAIGLVLWGAFATSLTHSVSSRMGLELQWPDICSALHDPQVLGNSQSGPADPSGETSQSGHCAYCLLCSPNWLPTTEFATAIAKFSALYAPPASDNSFALTRRLWASPHTRAPPL